jgi:uncharacterized RDD family membrane protein YckC
VPEPRTALDTQRLVAAPEGIELQLRLAGPVPRAAAWAIDLLVRLGLMLAFAGVAGALGFVGGPLLILAFFLIEWLYPCVWEVYFGGATPGKRALGMRVVHDDGRPIGWPGSLTRNLLRAADFFPMLYGAGLASMLMSKDFKRLGDFAAATVVVYDDPPRRARRIAATSMHPPPVTLSLAEQRTLLDFAERAAGLTEERAQELAQSVPSLIGSARGAEAIRLLTGYANYPAGGRR